MMNARILDSRRGFLRLTGSGLLALGTAGLASAQETKPAGQIEEEMQPEQEEKPAGREERQAGEQIPVTASEDLMREHGMLRRILLIYGGAVDRMQQNREVPFEELHRSADMVRRFVNEYHEKTEENEIFPRLERAGRLEAMTRVLREQHEASRRLTADILRMTESGQRETADRRRLQTTLCAYIRMYEPHAAQEDTIVFPALHEIMRPADYEAMGEHFEEVEHKRFGEDGFEKMVDSVAAIEKSMGLYDLAQYTPKELQGEPVGQ